MAQSDKKEQKIRIFRDNEFQWVLPSLLAPKKGEKKESKKDAPTTKEK